MSERLLRSLLLGFCLLAGQIGAHAHAIFHVSERHHQEGLGHEHEPVCGECLAFGHFGAAAPATPLPCPGTPPHAATGHRLVANPFSAPERTYRSRAPPCLSSNRY